MSLKGKLAEDAALEISFIVIYVHFLRAGDSERSVKLTCV